MNIGGVTSSPRAPQSANTASMRVLKGALKSQEQVVGQLLQGVSATPTPSPDPLKGNNINLIA